MRSQERFYIGNDSGTCYECRAGANRVPQRNAEAASVPHLSVAGCPYTLNGREERAPDWGISARVATVQLGLDYGGLGLVW